MSTITLPNIRVSSDLTVKLKLKDGGVAIDWSTLTNIRVSIFSDAQRALAGRCSASIDAEDSTLLVCTYAANKPQYVGVNRVVVSAKYMDETKTYDKPAFNFVRWTDDQEGQTITIDDPDIDVEISVEDVSSSILQEAVDAANTAAERANEAAEAAEHMVDIHTGPAGKSPYIGENGHWYEWDEATDQYVDTETNAKGDTGETPDITIGAVTTAEPGTPAAATMTGTPEDPVLNLTIPKGAVGATPNFTVGTVTTGAPGSSVIVTITGTAEAPVLNVTIPQGMQGNTGSSVDYPYELVNNLTTDDATKGLTAAQGKVLDGKVSQLEAEVNDIAIPMLANKSINLGGTLGATISLTPNTENGWYCGVFDCAEDDIFFVSGTGGNQTRLWGFVDADNKLIAVSNAGVSANHIEVIAPENASKFVTNSNGAAVSYYRKVGTINEKVFEMQEGLEDVSTKVVQLEGYVETQESGTYSEALIDANNKLLESRDESGKKTIYTDVKFLGDVEGDAIPDIKAKETTKYIDAVTDKDGRLVEATTPEGKKVFFAGVLNPDGTPLIQNKLQGKKWVVLGDSFSNGMVDNGTISEDGKYEGYRCVYPYIVGNRTGLDVVKFFEGGQTLAFPEVPGDFTNSVTCPTNSMYYQNIPLDADYITIYLGINDIGHASGDGGDGEDYTGVIPLGTPTDNTVNTYYGAWNVVLSWLRENRPFAHVGIIVCNCGSSPDYCTAQIAMANKYGYMYLDLNGDERCPAMLRSCNTTIPATVREKITEVQSVNYPTNKHPNRNAHLYESTFIENFLNSL